MHFMLLADNTVQRYC